MNKNYMTYPLKYMRITCRYDEGSHAKHNINVTDGNIDYPIDDAGRDTGRDPVYCPCDEMRVTQIRGVGSGATTNTIWLVSTSKVVTPTFTDIAFLVLTHSNDDDIKNIKIGDTYKRGDIICYEGMDGATANHIHITCGQGNSDDWLVNSNNSWVIKGNSKKPEEVFFIDRKFTEEIWGGNLLWKDLRQEVDKKIVGTPIKRDNTKNQVEVLVDNLNARESSSTTSQSYGYIKKGLYNVLDTKKNENYAWVKVESYWIAINEGWTKYYPKEENSSTCIDELNKLKNDYPKLIFTCSTSGKYLIYLEKGKKIYIK